MDKIDGIWYPMESAPRDGSCILAICKHDENSYVFDGGRKLTTYGAHCESFSHVPDGVHVLVWGGEYTDNYDEHLSFTIPNWWFRNGSDFEEVANPIGWLPIPGYTNMNIESEEEF